MKLKQITTIFLLTLTAICVNAQAIKGRITDKKNGEAVPFANVMIMTDTSANASLITGAVTDMDGRFSLQGKPDGKVLKIQFVGYDTKFVDLSSQLKSGGTIDLGDIAISQSATALKEVSVTAMRKRYTMDNDKIVMNVDDGVTATSANVFEMLKKVPGVMIDNDENITLNGKSGILFQFNGRDIRMPFESMKAFLKSMPANSVAKIETINNPSAKYEAEGTAGIINIIMAQAQTEGFSGTVSSWNSLTKDFRTFDNASLQYVNEKWTLSANGGFGFFNSLMQSESKQYIWQNADTTLIHLQPIEEHNKFRTANFSFSADYKIDSNNSVGGMFSFNRHRSPIVEGDPARVFLVSRYPYTDVVSSYTSDNDNPSVSNSYVGNVYYNRRLDTLGSQLSFSFDFDNNSNNAANLIRTSYYLGNLDSLLRNDNPVDSTNNRYGSYALKFDVVQQLSKAIAFEYGLKSRLSSVDNDFRKHINDDPLLVPEGNHLKYKENVNAAYVNFSHKVNEKLSYRAGLRFEHTYTNIESVTSDIDTSNNYFNLFPNVSISYRLGQMHSLSLSYAYRITRPDYNSLNPFVSKTSDYSFSSGNPDLLPQYSHRVDLNVSLFYALFITASYGYENNEINNITAAMPGQIATIQKPYNIGHQQFASLGLSGMLPIGPVEWMFWMQGSYNQAKADSPQLTMNVESFSFMTWQSLSVKLPWELKLSVNGFYLSGMYREGMQMGDMLSFSTSLSRYFFNKSLQVSIGAQNIPRRKLEINSSYNNFRNEMYVMWDKPHMTLQIQYNFGKTANNNTLKRIKSDDMDDRAGEGGGIQQPGANTGGGMGQ